MASYESKSDEEKAAIQSVANAARGMYIALQGLADDGQILAAAWNGGISDMVNSLDPAEVIPDTSGLDGAQSISKADLINTVGYFIDLSNPANNQGGGGYNTPFHQALRVKFAGINAAASA